MSRVALKTLLDRSNKNMANGTHAVVRQTALEVIRRAYAEGINVQISEGHRSYARQNALYAQGRTTSGNIVTNARGGQSWHNFGIAVDFFLTNHSGNKAVWTVNSNWRRVAQIAKNLGFEWGGDWTSFRDYPHLQMTGGLTIAQMRAGRKPNLVSKVGSTSKATAKWVKNNTGWWFQNANGSYPKSGWQYINKKWYLFDSRGYMLTDWQKVKGTWYYMTKSGAMQTGWNKVGNTWYYMGNSGAMQTGWKKVGPTWYYMNSSGAMQSGWLKLGKDWYFLQPNGAMATGWFKPTKEGPWFYANSSGRMQTGWIYPSKTWYYLNSSGHMQTGLITLNGEHFMLKDSGALVENDVVKLQASSGGYLR